MDTKTLLKVRNDAKKRKPFFAKHDSYRRKELPKKWRRPKGLHAKMRLGKKGHPRCVAVGFGSPSLVKGLSRSGLRTVLVRCVNDLKKANPETDCVVVAGGVGLKKKVEIVKNALEARLKIGNLKEPERFLSENKERFEKRREEKKKPKKVEEKIKEKAPKEKSVEEKLTEKERKEAEKMEKDRVLTKRA